MSKKTMQSFIKTDLSSALKSYYANIGSNIFKWENMPKEIPARYPEKTLYQQGQCVFMEIPNAGFACLPVATESIQKNIYGEPSSWRAIALGNLSGIVSSQQLNPDNSVLIYNDYTYQDTATYVNSLVKQLVNVEITARMNVNAQKNPMWFKTNDMNVLQNKNTFIDWFEGEPVYFKDDLATSEFEFINPGIQFIGNELEDLYNVYHYRILNYLGIDNAGVDKKERMLVSESQSQNDAMMMIRESRLNQRKIACEKINEIFGLNVSVDVNDKLNSENQEMASLQQPQQFGNESENNGKEN